MTMRVNEIGTLLPEKVIVGLSSIVGVSSWPGQLSCVIKISAGGSLEIGGTYVLSAGATAAFTWGNGYLMGASEILSINQMGTFYLAATGSTVTATILRQRSPGIDQ